jgi:hypothetical protein
MMMRRVAESTAPSWPDKTQDDLWDPSWFPLIGGGQPVAVDCSIPDGAPTPVRYVDWERVEDYWMPHTQSLGEMIGWWMDALDSGIWYWDRSRLTWEERPGLRDNAYRMSPLV